MIARVPIIWPCLCSGSGVDAMFKIREFRAINATQKTCMKDLMLVQVLKYAPTRPKSECEWFVAGMQKSGSVCRMIHGGKHAEDEVNVAKVVGAEPHRPLQRFC